MGAILLPDAALGFLPRHSVVSSGKHHSHVSNSCLKSHPIIYRNTGSRKRSVRHFNSCFLSKEKKRKKEGKKKKKRKKFIKIWDLFFAGNFCTQIIGCINQDQLFSQAGYAYTSNSFHLFHWKSACATCVSTLCNACISCFAISYQIIGTQRGGKKEMESLSYNYHSSTGC